MTAADDAFDEGAYLAANPDVAAAFANGLIETGRAHWRDAGEAETRAGHRPGLLDASGAPGSPRPELDEAATGAALAGLGALDVAAYFAMNPDLAAAFGTDHAAGRRHWVTHGRLEGRIGPGDAPYRDRAVSLERLLALPFGIDLYMPALEIGLEGQAGHQLLASLRAAGIAVSVRPYDDRADIPRVTAAAGARPPGHRVSLFVASPLALRALHRMLQRAVFDATYVVGLVPRLALARHMPDYPLFGLLDELWVASEAAALRLAAVAPLPVRQIALPPRPLPPRDEARRLLGLPQARAVLALDATASLAVPDATASGAVPDATALLAVPDATALLAVPDATALLAVPDATALLAVPDATASGAVPDPTASGAVSDATASGAVLHGVLAQLGRRARADGPLLLVRATLATAAAVDAALRDTPGATFRCDPLRPGEGSLVLAAADAVLRTDAIAHELAGHEARLRPMNAAAMAVFLAADPDGAPPAAAPPAAAPPTAGTTPAEAGARIRAILEHLGLTIPQPRFTATIGRTRDAMLPAAMAPGAGGVARPVLSLLLPGAGLDRPALDLVVAALGAQAHPFWELCVDWPAGAVDPGRRRAALPPDPRIRLVTAPGAARWSASTGDHVLPVRDRDEALRRAGQLVALAALIAREDPDLVVRADPDASAAVFVDTIEAGGPAAEPIALRRALAADDLAGVVLRLARAEARIAAFADAAGIGPPPLAAEEIGRRARRHHVRRALGPTAFVEPGLLPATWRIRRRWPAGVAPCALRLGGGAMDLRHAILAAEAEHVVLLWGGTVPEGDAVAALAELLLDDGIGAAGGLVLRDADATAAQATQGRGPGHAVLRVRNVDVADGGALAVRRSALFGRPGAVPAIVHPDLDAQAATLCRTLHEAAGLRVVATPFARFRRPV